MLGCCAYDTLHGCDISSISIRRSCLQNNDFSVIPTWYGGRFVSCACWGYWPCMNDGPPNAPIASAFSFPCLLYRSHMRSTYVHTSMMHAAVFLGATVLSSSVPLLLSLRLSPPHSPCGRPNFSFSSVSFVFVQADLGFLPAVQALAPESHRPTPHQHGELRAGGCRGGSDRMVR